MLNTIEECKRELERIDMNLKRLKLERQHVLSVQELLESKNDAQTLLNSKSNKHRTLPEPFSPKIFEIIKGNPGITHHGISDLLDNKYTGVQISNALSALRKGKVKSVNGSIENRGANGQGAQWYVREN